MSIRPSAGSRAAPPRGEPSGRSGRNLGLALVVIATAQLMVVLDAVLGYSALRAGVAFLPFAGTMVVASGVASRLRTRTGTRPPLLAGAAVAAGGMYWFSQVSVRTTYLSGLLGPSLVTAAGLGLLFVPLSLLALDRVRAEDSGLAAGAAQRRPAGRRRDWVGGARHGGVDGGGQQRPRPAHGGRPIRPLPGQRPGAGCDLPRRPRNGYRPRVPGGFGVALAAAVTAVVAIRVRREDLPDSAAAAQGQPVRAQPAMAGHSHVAGLATESADIAGPRPREGAPR